MTEALSSSLRRRLIKTIAPKVKAEHDGGAPAEVQPTDMVGYGAFGQTTSSFVGAAVRRRGVDRGVFGGGGR